MQQRFLSLFGQLLNSQNPTPITGFWLIHTDEPLVAQWLIGACRPIWQACDQTIKRIDLASHKSWGEVITELDSLSLFGDTSAIIVTGNHKPKNDKDGIDVLATLERLSADTPHHLIWCLPKQDKKLLATKAIRLFDTHGIIIDGNIYDERMRRELLQMQAAHLGVQLTLDAWQMLLAHTENNLLTAHQNLWRLSLLYPNATVDDTQLMASLVDGAEFSVFDLSDVTLHGNAQKALQILTHLKNTDIAPSLILWSLAKDARLISQIHTGKSPESLGIWRNKVSLYMNAARRTPPPIAQHWAAMTYQIDKTIKGVHDGDVWHLLQRFVLSLCGMAA